MKKSRIYKMVVSVFLFGTTLSAHAQTIDLGNLNRDLSHFRPRDQRGINVFEDPKEEGAPFEGVQVRVGGQFALQYQALDHENNALPRIDDATGVNLNELISISNDFNLATANLDLDIQLAKGVRSHLRTYMSSRHHPEPYVKDGYLLVDSLDIIEEGFLSDVMDILTIKLGHMEINYGDLHFRRSDSAQGIYNPFVGNTIMDSFSTEVGIELYARYNGFMLMVGATNGKLDQTVANTERDGTSVISKVGWDDQVTEDLRLRFTASIYNAAGANPVRLYQGDRAGSRYYFVTENVNATAKGNFRSGRFNPGLNRQLRAIMLNAFAKYQGLEVLGTYENAKGHDNGEMSNRTFDHFVAEAVYRFGRNERFYFGGRYNIVKGPLRGMTKDITIDRYQVGLGWFLTENMLGKLEYVRQEYDDFPETNILSGAKFDGLMVESVISF
jgi:hypothetical protein